MKKGWMGREEGRKRKVGKGQRGGRRVWGEKLGSLAHPKILS
jgi:hypothetical protein